MVYGPFLNKHVQLKYTYTNLGRQVARATKFCTVVPHIYRSSVWIKGSPRSVPREAHRTSRDVALNLGDRWGWVVNATP
jgi:hypothetical protein